MTDTALALRQGQAIASALGWNQELIDLLTRTICRGATTDELALFLQVCQRTGLDPFVGEIHAVKRYDSALRREVMTIQTAVKGYRKKASETGLYDGTAGPYWKAKDGDWTEVWESDEFPYAAKFTVFKKGAAHPFTATCKWSSFVQITKEGGPNKFWRTMPDHMLGNAAERHALMRAFPGLSASLPPPSQSLPEIEGRVIDSSTGEIYSEDAADALAEEYERLQQTTTARQPAARAATAGPASPQPRSQPIGTAATPQYERPAKDSEAAWHELEDDTEGEPPADQQMAAAGAAPLPFPNQPRESATSDAPSAAALRQAKALHDAAIASPAAFPDVPNWDAITAYTAGQLADFVLATTDRLDAARKEAAKAKRETAGVR